MNRSRLILLIIVIPASSLAIIGALFLMSQGANLSLLLPFESSISGRSNGGVVVGDQQSIAADASAIPYQEAVSNSVLECRLEKSADGGSASVSAKLVDKATGVGIADRQLLIVVLPGNPVADSFTDQSGEAKALVDLSEFGSKPSSMFIFFDGDNKHDFTSCEIKLDNT